MTREETVRNLLTELIDMVDNGSQKDLDRADEIGASIIKLFEQEPVLDKIRAEIEQKIVRRSGLNHTRAERDRNDAFLEVLDIIDKYQA